jgi:hypothetical protein
MASPRQEQFIPQMRPNWAHIRFISNDKAVAGDIPDVEGAIDLTFECWIFVDDTTATRTICSKGDLGAVATANWQFRVTSDNKLECYVYDGSSSAIVQTAVNTITDSTWTHVAFVFTAGSKLEVFKDGSSVGSDTTSVPNSINNNANGFRIGMNYVSSSDTNPFSGYIDDVRIWNTAKTEAQIGAAKDAELSIGAGVSMYGSMEGMVI